MARTFQIKRGEKATMPTLAQGEFGFVTDNGAEELHIGNGSQNIQIARQDYVDEAIAAIPTPESDIFIVRITSDSENNYSIDKTLSEIAEAAEAGKVIVGLDMEDGSATWMCSYADPWGVIFERWNSYADGGVTSYRIEIDEDGSVYTSYEVAGTEYVDNAIEAAIGTAIGGSY